jgi:hypothetical protein
MKRRGFFAGSLVVGPLLALFALVLSAPSQAPGVAIAGGNEKPVVTSFVLSARGTKSTKFTSGQTVNVTLTATDDVRVRKYFLCDGCTEPPVAGSLSWLSAKPKSFTIFSAAGVHTVRAWVQDANENISKPKVAKIFRDGTRPLPDINFPRSQEILNSLTRIGGDIGEFLPSSGMAGGEYAILRRADCSWWDPKKEQMVKGRCGDEQWIEFNLPVTAKTFAAQIGTLDVKGTYSLTVRLTDRAGNIGLGSQKFFIR